MAADSIHHIYIETHNWGKSVAFWRELGFELDEDPGKTSALLRPRGGGPYIYLAEIPAERELKVDGMVLRYRTEKTDDGLTGAEGAFIACSFWLADAYLLLGRRKEAEALFERLVGYCNDVGLLSEEIDPRDGSFLGNFPQAFSHVALLDTAANLGRAEKPAEQRSEHRAEPAAAK